MSTKAENDARTSNQEGFGKRVQRVLPESWFRILTRTFNSIVSLIPFSIKYGIGTALRRRKYPYRLIEEGDLVVQVGCPRDILHAGRSRTMYFCLLVGKTGKVFVVEADPANCVELKAYAIKHGIWDRIILNEIGAWSDKATLEFLSSASHPASNVLADVTDVTDEQRSQRDYESIIIPVDSVDNLLDAAGITEAPKLISFTPNAGELEIIKGMFRAIDKGLTNISTSATKTEFVDFMKTINFELKAIDDRGYFFMKGE